MMKLLQLHCAKSPGDHIEIFEDDSLNCSIRIHLVDTRTVVLTRDDTEVLLATLFNKLYPRDEYAHLQVGDIVMHIGSGELGLIEISDPKVLGVRIFSKSWNASWPVHAVRLVQKFSPTLESAKDSDPRA